LVRARMTLRFKLQLVVMADDEEMCVNEVVVLDKQHEWLEHLGLSLAEAKALLVELQQQILTRQVAAFLAAHVSCTSCTDPAASRITRRSSFELCLAIWSWPARG
jgi:hypothetical protein